MSAKRSWNFFFSPGCRISEVWPLTQGLDLQPRKFFVAQEWMARMSGPCPPRTCAAKGESAYYPQENFYGWLINDREAELRKLL